MGWQMKYLGPRTLNGKMLKTRDMKMERSISSLCKNYCSAETIDTMVTYFEVVRNMDFEEEPKYDDLRILFHDHMKSKGFENDGILIGALIDFGAYRININIYVHLNTYYTIYIQLSTYSIIHIIISIGKIHVFLI